MLMFMSYPQGNPRRASKAPRAARGERAPRARRLLLPVNLASGSTLRDALRALCADAGIVAEGADDLGLAACEAFNNAILHGTSRPDGCIEARLTVSPSGGRVMLRYRGEPFVAGAPCLPESSATGGRGRFLIHCLTDSAELRFDNGWTEALLVKRWG
jgi:anti-sigma regulatory factor (Ser/Thr protein kinase)